MTSSAAIPLPATHAEFARVKARNPRVAPILDQMLAQGEICFIDGENDGRKN